MKVLGLSTILHEIPAIKFSSQFPVLSSNSQPPTRNLQRPTPNSQLPTSNKSLTPNSGNKDENGKVNLFENRIDEDLTEYLKV